MSGSDTEARDRLPLIPLAALIGLGLWMGSPEPRNCILAGVLAAGSLWTIPPGIAAIFLGASAVLLSQAALVHPLGWLLLTIACGLSVGWRRGIAVVGLAGIGATATGTLHPGLWPVLLAGGLLVAAPAVAAADRRASWLWLALVMLGGLRGHQASLQVDAAELIERPRVAERLGAPWTLPRIEAAFDEARILPEDKVDRMWMWAEAGAPTLAMRTLGFDAVEPWECAALRSQAGLPTWRSVAEPEDTRTVPGAVLSLERPWEENQSAVIPVRVDRETQTMTVGIRGEFFLGSPEVHVWVDGMRYGPFTGVDEGAETQFPVRLSPGLHRVVVRFENAHRNGPRKRRITALEISVD